MSLVLFAGTLLLFSRSAGFGFVDLDDGSHIFNNPHVQAGLTGESLRWIVTGNEVIWNPLTRLSHVIDGQLFGLQPWGHHLTSILWHAANAALVFLVLHRLTGSFWSAALCAALFAWHPLRVESVTWVSERKDVLSGFFFLLTLWSYAGYAECRRIGGSGVWRQYGFTLLCFLCGLLSKPMLVTLPGVLLLLDVWPLRRGPSPGLPALVGGATPTSTSAISTWAALLVEKIPFGALSIIFAIISVHTQQANDGFALQLQLPERLANAVVSVARYLGKFFWPFDLVVFYPHPGTWPAFAVTGALLLLLALTAATLWQWRRRPWLLVGWLWFLGTLLPVIGLVQVGLQSIADRYTYLPSLGLTLILVWALRVIPLARIATVSFAGVLLLGCALRTFDQQRTWRSSVALYEHALARNAKIAFAHAFLGYSMLKEDRDDEAALHARLALELEPNNRDALYTRGWLHSKQDRLTEAAADFKAALALNRSDARAAFALGLIQLRQRLPGDAETSFRTALTLQSENIAFLLALAELESTTGRAQEGARRCEAALLKHPTNPGLHTRYSAILTRLGNIPAALAHAEKALQLAPTEAVARANYANLLRLSGRIAEACEHYRKASAAAPEDADIHFGLGIALGQNNEPEAALTAFETAARLRPSLTAAHVEIGELLLARGEAAHAAERFRQALASDSSVVPALLGLSRASVQLGAYDEAAGCLQRAIELQPANPAPYATWAEILARQGRFAEAIPPYEKLISLQPADAGAHAAFGYALFFAGRKADARHEWEEALRLNPAFPKLRERLDTLPR